jgi:hypothetical protein
LDVSDRRAPYSLDVVEPAITLPNHMEVSAMSVRILKKGRCDHVTKEEALSILRELEGPLLELVLSRDSWDITACDVPTETLLCLLDNPKLAVLFPDHEEWNQWERYKEERGCGANEIGEFVYGPEKNPWA